LLLLVAGLGVINPAAHAAGTGSVSASGGVLYSDCRQHAYTYALSLPADTASWNLDVTVLGPDGLYSAGDFLYDDADPATGVADFQLCGGELAGLYTITATLTTYDADYTESATALPNVNGHVAVPVGGHLEVPTLRVFGQVMVPLPKRCCAACRVVPRRSAIAVQGYWCWRARCTEAASVWCAARRSASAWLTQSSASGASVSVGVGSRRVGCPLPRVERSSAQAEHSGMEPTRTVAVSWQPGRVFGSGA
jgi:hypothetical protein